MNKIELINEINSIVDFGVNGYVKRDDREFHGHPNFYILHTKEEFDKELNRVIPNKETYDRYDLFYYSNYMFKYMLNQYDSHTFVVFMNSFLLPIKIRIINDFPYIVDGVNVIKGSRIQKINGVDIVDIIKNIESIICYASSDYLKISLEDCLNDINVLKSLPAINIHDEIIITTDKGEYKFDLNNLDKYIDKTQKENYQLDVVDRTAVISYKSCKDIDKMNELVDKLNNLDGIDNYIVDLRGNGGGQSAVNGPLVSFLKDKNVVVLCDERVFSSARMCLVDLKRNGAKIIGTRPGTPINCFGNNVMKKSLFDMKLEFKGSATYWYYDDNYRCHGYYKDNFKEELANNPHILDIVFLDVDEEKELTLDDYINHKDSVLEYALETINKQRKL